MFIFWLLEWIWNLIPVFHWASPLAVTGPGWGHSLLFNRAFFKKAVGFSSAYNIFFQCWGTAQNQFDKQQTVYVHVYSGRERFLNLNLKLLFEIFSFFFFFFPIRVFVDWKYRRNRPLLPLGMIQLALRELQDVYLLKCNLKMLMWASQLGYI